MRACAKCCTIYDVRMWEGSSFVSRPAAARLVALRRHAAAGRSLVRVRHAEAHVLAARPWHAGPGVHHRAGADARGLAAKGEARAHQGLAAVEASLAKRRARLAEDRARRAENAVRLRVRRRDRSDLGRRDGADAVARRPVERARDFVP